MVMDTKKRGSQGHGAHPPKGSHKVDKQSKIVRHGHAPGHSKMTRTSMHTRRGPRHPTSTAGTI